MERRDLAGVVQLAFTDLQRFGAKAALVGGLAVSIRTRPRLTKDVDFSVAVRDEREAERLVRAFLRAGYRHGVILEHEQTGRLATVRLYVPESQSTEPDVDLLFAACGVEQEVVAAATSVSLTGIGLVPVASTAHLIAMKVLAESDAREHDRADLRALLAVADRLELQLARKLVRLIEKRGFARGKNLVETLERFTKRSK